MVIVPPDGSGYECSEHVGWDLRLIADGLDSQVGYATANANVLRVAAQMLDKLPVNTSHNRALELAREAMAKERAAK